MDVLDSRIGEVDFSPEQNANFHMDAFGIKAIAQRMVTEKKVRQCDNQARTGQDGANDVIFPQHFLRPIDGKDLFGYRLADHRSCVAMRAIELQCSREWV